ncbi:MAG: cysteine--tRNA ligase [Candidatus Helarchaeota archaeon]|nr:cysteine--tRNA ligase [Candidatus Helarchaeota archaeon]
MLKLYNDLTGKKEEFIPLEKNKVKMYVCGPTVYDYSHVGHARSYVFFDIMYRYLKFRGFDVIYIQNLTDIDDKIIKRAREENLTIFELADKYTDLYFRDMKKLRALSADYFPRATQHIPDMIEAIKILIQKGYAYESNGNVYFAVDSFQDYGKLSRKPFEELIDSEDSPDKRNPKDFALWKRKKEDEPFWESPWGLGRPGWHIECSIMSTKYLGSTLDIHGGGQDLVFPHHENEIAQTEAYTGKKFVKYWIHNGFLTVNKEKMSKSLKNFFTIQEVLEKRSPENLRCFLISTHYRKPMEFCEENLDHAQRVLERFYVALESSRNAHFTENKNLLKKLTAELEKTIQQTESEFILAMDDDFNTPLALSHLQTLAREINKITQTSEIVDPEIMERAHKLLLELGSILGIYMENKESFSDKLVDMVLAIRQQARQNKDYALSDKIRDELNKLNIEVKDLPNKTIWYKKI